MFRTLTLSVLALIAVGAQATVWNVSANMDAAQHGLPFLPGTGTMLGTYDDVTNVWTISAMSAASLTNSVSISHLHLGGSGVNGAPLIDLGSTAGGQWSGSGGNWTYVGPATKVVSEINEAAFLSGGTYINVHTSFYPAGEVRGQVIADAVPEPATMALVGLAALAAIRRRRAR